jgi:hypothetical protein
MDPSTEEYFQKLKELKVLQKKVKDLQEEIHTVEKKVTSWILTTQPNQKYVFNDHENENQPSVLTVVQRKQTGSVKKTTLLSEITKYVETKFLRILSPQEREQCIDELANNIWNSRSAKPIQELVIQKPKKATKTKFDDDDDGQPNDSVNAQNTTKKRKTNEQASEKEADEQDEE